MSENQPYDNTNSGALFKNERKETANQPDYRGNLNVNGQDFWISAWIKTSRSNVKYMSLSVQPKDDDQGGNQRPAQGQRQQPPANQGNHEPIDPDQIPF